MMSSRKRGCKSFAAAKVRGRLTAMMPPNGEMVSAASAEASAASMVDAVATPQGQACLIMAAVGEVKSATIFCATSASTRLL